MPTDSSSLDRKRKPAPIDDAKHRSGSERSTTSSTSSTSSDTHKSAVPKKASSSSSSTKRARARFSIPEDAQGLSRFASHTGFLRKQADNEQGAWNKYYFALRPATLLYYYNAPTDAKPRGIIDLEFLKDVRLNVDCLQRAVGGSEHCFRVTGQMPKREEDAGSNNSSNSAEHKLRPVYLDPESAVEAQEWMQALQHHRFNAEHAHGFYTLSTRIQATEATLHELENEVARVAAAAESIRRSGRALLHQLRGLDAPPDAAPSSNRDVLVTLQEIESLVEDFNAEAVQQAKVIATLRERDALQEKKLRELAKLAAAPPAPVLRPAAVGGGGGAADDSSILSADELTRMERAGASKARSTSDVRGLFKVRTNFLGKKAVDTDATAAAVPPASSPKAPLPPVLEPCAEGPEPDEDESDEAPVKKKGFAGVFKKRVAKTAPAPTTVTVTTGGTPTGRESDNKLVLPTADDSASSAPVGPTDALPRGWTKHASRTSPGDHYFVHTASGFTCWEIPSDFVADVDEPDEPPVVSEEKTTDKGKDKDTNGNPEPVPAVPDPTPLESFAAVTAAVMEEAAPDESSASDDATKPPAKKASKGWKLFKKFPKPGLSKAAAAPASPQSPVAVEHDDGRTEF